MKTKNETVIEAKGTHNYNCDPGECKAKKVLNETKRRAHYPTPTVANANEISEKSYDHAVQPAMLKKDNLLRAVSQKRQKMCIQISAPTDQNLDVFDEFAPFFRQDNVKDDNERILKFRRCNRKNLLNFCSTCLVDGTFILSLKFFSKYTQSM